VLVSADRVPDDHGHPFRVHAPVGPSGVEERRSSRRHRPLLAHVELLGDLRRHRQPPPQGIPRVVPDPATDLAVRLVRHGRVGVVVAVGVPAFRWHVADGVTAVAEVLPEGGRVGSVRHDRGDADDGDG
jgi:hypothetical protein